MNLLIRNIDRLILVFLLLIFFILNVNLLLVEPLVWPDESYIADVARNVTRNAGMGTSLWGNSVIGIDRFLYWYPPIYINTLALWFKLFGLSIVNQRILSIIFGMLFLTVIYFLSQNLFGEISFKKKKFISLGLIIFLIFDNSFLKASKIGRPEMLTVLLGFLALYIYQLVEKLQYKKVLYILIGFVLGLTSLTHFLGIFFLIIILGSMLYRKDKMFNFLVIGFIPPILIWLISVVPNYDIFLNQLINV
ncbi:MAG: glycosyltransferase family 39 protein [Actinobacteria bacterium]|nr:glycosyltransferase family 39 protein [Actinomycetota bacterium]